MKSIVLNLTQKCNAKCAHCCFGCLPNSDNYLTDFEIEKIVQYAENHEDVKVVSLTGGEALLRKAKVLEITKRLSSVGKEVTLISNGFWATNDRTTRRILTELTEAGLKYLTISFADSSIESLEKKFYSNILLYILKEEGLSWFIEKMNLDISDMKFVSTCEICKYIFSDIDRINAITDDMKLYYDENFESI